jgi:hypothetical protein
MSNQALKVAIATGSRAHYGDAMVTRKAENLTL